jgi:phosphate transport system substrate-binding protein
VKTLASIQGESQRVYSRATGHFASPADGAIHQLKLMPSLVAAIIAVSVVWICIILVRWRRISWRDHMDSAINLLPREARWRGTWAPWKVFAHHEEVAAPSLVLLRIKNSGFANVGEADIRRPITFTFPGREVKEFTLSDCHGITRETIQPPGTPGPIVTGNRIALPRFPMRRRSSFKLLVLLSGTDRGVLGKARIRRGRFEHDGRRRGPTVRNLMFGTVLALLVGTQAGVTLSQGPVIPSSCGTGRLTLEGSTAFAPVARQIASEYTSTCRMAAISVSAIATFNGLNAVNSAGGQQRPAATGQIAMSDGPAPSGYPELVGHPIAVIIFAVVVNRRVNVFNLTTAEVRDMFAGRITNWRQVGGANLPVRIVGRTTGSGTRRTFDDKVLGGDEPAFSSYNCVDRDAVPSSPVIRCEVADTSTLLQRVNQIPGAIGYAQISDAASYPDVETVKLNGWDPQIGAVEQGAYPFWTVEYLYSYGNPGSGTLAASFLSFLNSDAAKDALRSDAYTPCVDRQQSLLSTLCKP